MNIQFAEEPRARLFDRVIVVSLRHSIERRRYVEHHLADNGLEQFEFFDATGPDDPRVAHAYESGEVFAYPPCFRCGQLDCGNPDCNNVLLPAQVGTYLTYLRLWREVADGSAKRVLILEDDVKLDSRALAGLAWIEHQVRAERLPFIPDRACLLRLGWAYGAEHHQENEQFRFSEEVRMANPAHAITKEYARRLLERHTRIRHTVDVFQHRLAPKLGEAFTIHPPLASELSWSDGTFESHIHPKAVREEHLRKLGRDDEAEAARRTRSNHVKKLHFLRLLISGHPRCGTGYAGGLCRQLGLDIGHEKIGSEGISSWMFAVDADRNPYALDEMSRTRRRFVWQYLVVPVRNLVSAVPSVIRDSIHARPSYDFRREHIRKHFDFDIDCLPNELERAIWSITLWYRLLLSQEPDLCFRIEDQHERLRAFLLQQALVPDSFAQTSLDISPVNADKPYGGVRYRKPEVSLSQWSSLGMDTQREVDWYVASFGYPSPIDAQARPN